MPLNASIKKRSIKVTGSQMGSDMDSLELGAILNQAMSVQDLIDALFEVRDRTMPVMIRIMDSELALDESYSLTAHQADEHYGDDHGSRSVFAIEGCKKGAWETFKREMLDE